MLQNYQHVFSSFKSTLWIPTDLRASEKHLLCTVCAYEIETFRVKGPHLLGRDGTGLEGANILFCLRIFTSFCLDLIFDP